MLKRIKNNQGLGIIEIVLYVAIFSIATIIVMNFMVQGYKVYYFGQEQTDAIRFAGTGIKTMVREIREARPADNGSYPLELADDQLFIFFSDIDQDDKTERVRYFLDGTDFKKGIINPSENEPITYDGPEETITLSKYVRNGADPIFYYYNGDWPADTTNNPLPAPARLIETKLMRVLLRINVFPERSPDDFELESSAQIRNLKTNL
ncbi:hypothetical protein HQ544_03675 [Candidatus Falkowbacteria bacterium]|nr:hypothetical protein [Candidatus Falkowbacteria bacterium]